MVRDPSGAIIGYEGTLADISKRKAREMQLSEEKEKAQVTLQSIGDAVLTVDADGRIEYLNPVAEELTGWTTVEAQGRPVAEVFHIAERIDQASDRQPDPPLPAGGPHGRARPSRRCWSTDGCRRSRSRTRRRRSATARAD